MLVAEKAESLRRRDAVSRVNLAYREYLDDNVALADELLDGCPTDLREWEWEYARRLGHSELKTFPGSSQGQDVWSVAFSPDGELLACGSGPWGFVGDRPTGELVVRSVQTGNEVFAVRGLTGAVQALAFSPDGRQLAAAWGFTGKDQGAVLAVFDSSRRARRSGRSLSEAFKSSAWRTPPTAARSPAVAGRSTIATRSVSPGSRDAATGTRSGQPITGGPGGVLCVAFSPDGRQLALASRDVVDICDLSSPRPDDRPPTAGACQLRLCGCLFPGRSAAWPPVAGTRPSGSGTVQPVRSCKP